MSDHADQSCMCVCEENFSILSNTGNELAGNRVELDNIPATPSAVSSHDGFRLHIPSQPPLSRNTYSSVFLPNFAGRLKMGHGLCCASVSRNAVCQNSRH